MSQLGSLQIGQNGHSAKLSTVLGFVLQLHLGQQFSDTAKSFQSGHHDDGTEFLSVSYANEVKLLVDVVYNASSTGLDLYHFSWHRPPEAQPQLDSLKDSIDWSGTASSPTHWYGGPNMAQPQWPINVSDTFPATPYLVSDVFLKHANISGQERYWLSSAHIALSVPQTVPLWVGLDVDGTLSLEAKRTGSPYANFDEEIAAKLPFFEYHIAIASAGTAMSLQQFYSSSFSLFLKSPKELPDKLIIEKPIWSTWAKFRTNVRETDVRALADNITSYGFPISQLELDDKWTTEYGAFEVDREKFPNFKSMVEKLKKEGIRLTAWVHPFVNLESKNAKDPELSRYFVQSSTEEGGLRPGEVGWWNGRGYVVDFTNSDAVKWFTSQLTQMQTDYGIYSFKFDGGEVMFLPENFRLHTGSVPNDYCREYAKLAARFGPAVENRIASSTQELPIFYRTLDRQSTWYTQGLQTLIPSVLGASLHGYFWNLPDMIGGNGHYERDGMLSKPEKELYIRWAQASTFLIAMQFSFAPFDYDAETVSICRQLLELRSQFYPYLLGESEKAVRNSQPVVRPMWWLSDDEEALRSNDQFLVGDDLLVAPVVIRGARQRNVYLPKGAWKQNGARGSTYEGLRTVNIEAPLDSLPYFQRVNTPSGSSAASSYPLLPQFHWLASLTAICSFCFVVSACL